MKQLLPVSFVSKRSLLLLQCHLFAAVQLSSACAQRRVIFCTGYLSAHMHSKTKLLAVCCLFSAGHACKIYIFTCNKLESSLSLLDVQTASLCRSFTQLFAPTSESTPWQPWHQSSKSLLHSRVKSVGRKPSESSHAPEKDVINEGPGSKNAISKPAGFCFRKAKWFWRSVLDKGVVKRQYRPLGNSRFVPDRKKSWYWRGYLKIQ